MEPNGHDDSGDQYPPLTGASDTEINALVEEVLQSGKHLTIPKSGDVSMDPRFHARSIARQMTRLARQLSMGPDEAAAGDDIDEWWFEVAGQRIGPISLRKARYLWEEGELSVDSLCWHEGFSSWVQLFKVNELAEALAPRKASVEPVLEAAAKTVPPIEPPPLPDAPEWTPSAPGALAEAQRAARAPKRLEDSADREYTTLPAPPSQPSPQELAGTFSAIPRSEAGDKRGGLSHALVSGLVAGGVVAAALIGARFLLPDSTAPVQVVVPAPSVSGGAAQGAGASETRSDSAARSRSASPAETSRASSKLRAARSTVAAEGSTTVTRRASEAKAEVTEGSPAPASGIAKKPAAVDDAFMEAFKPRPDELETSEIFEVVKRNSADVDACVQTQKAAAPESTGKVVMRWNVSLDGQVSNVSVRLKEEDGAPFAGCLEKAISGWTFPKHEVAHEPVEFPFRY